MLMIQIWRLMFQICQTTGNKPGIGLIDSLATTCAFLRIAVYVRSAVALRKLKLLVLE